MIRHLIGWSASFVLLCTILSQIYRQWEARSSKGVSAWLFIGQCVASAGFLIYSWLVQDVVFIVTNALLLVSAAVGLGILLRHRQINPDEGEGAEPTLE
ncbi:SemiSWEET family sugar transporter [Nitrospira sp. Nam80]